MGSRPPRDVLLERLAGKRDVIRASIDGFHRPRAERCRRGDLSPEGAYHDAGPDEVLRRALVRDTRLMGGPDRIRERYRR